MRITLHDSSSNWHEQKSLMWIGIHFAPCLTITFYLSCNVAILLILAELQQLQDLASSFKNCCFIRDQEKTF